MPRVTFRNVLDVDASSSVSIAMPSGSMAMTGRNATPVIPGTVSTWFKADFSDIDAAGTSQYNFGYFYGSDATGTPGYWSLTHLATGAHDGGPCPSLTRDDAQDQFSMGWAVTDAKMGGQTFSIGDHFFLRFRVRLDPTWRFEPTPTFPANAQNKFILMGNTGVTPNSRVVVFIQSPQGNFQCMLGSDPHNTGAWVDPVDFGLSGSDWLDAGLLYKYGSISAHVNIGTECVGPCLITYAGNPNTPAPGPNSAVPVDGWHHVQIYAKSGNGTAEFKIWDNNNDFDNPTQSMTGLTLGVDGWDGGFTIGGQTTGPITPDPTYRIGAAEIGPTFDPNWTP